MTVVSGTDRRARLAAVLAATGFAGLAVFQAALAAGAPWGHAAWGGERADLSAAQQGASAVAAVFYVAAALIVLCRAGVIWPARSGAAIFRWGTWFFAAALALGALPNFGIAEPLGELHPRPARARLGGAVHRGWAPRRDP